MGLTRDNAMFGHVDEATAYEVGDYPYGFRLRTKIRYWIETSAKHGDRLVSQTLNPKVAHEHWNKPKKSTYSAVGVMYLDEQEHVTWAGLNEYTDEDAIYEFLDKVDGHLSDAQRAQVAKLVAARRVMRNVTVSIHQGPRTEEEQAEQDKVARWMNHRWAIESDEAKRELDAIQDGIVRRS